MGRWSAAHWKTATFGWLALVFVAFGIGGAIGTKTIDPNTAGPGESGRMDRILEAGFKQPAHEAVLIQSTSLRTSDPAFEAAIADVVAAISGLEVVQHVRSPLAPGNEGQIAKDGRAALVEFDIRGDKDLAVDKIGPVLDRVDEVQKAHPGLFVGEFGDASAVDGLNTAMASDLEKAGLFSLPITLIILVAAFGALVAAGIPLLLGLTAVFGTFGLVALPSHLLPIAPEASAMVLLIGLAVGVDYSMFYLRRAREERAAGRSERAAIEAAAATSGHSVLVAGLTVIAAMAGHVPDRRRDVRVLRRRHDPRRRDGDGRLADRASGAALAARRQGRPAARVPLVGRLRRDDGEGRIWGAIVDRVLRRPVVSVVVAGGLLVALAVPALQLRMVQSGPETFPQYLAGGEDVQPHARTRSPARGSRPTSS